MELCLIRIKGYCAYPLPPLSKHLYLHYVQKQYCYPFETNQQISLPYSRLLNNYKLATLILYTTFQFQKMMPVQISAWFLNPNPTNCCTALNQVKPSLWPNNEVFYLYSLLAGSLVWGNTWVSWQQSRQSWWEEWPPRYSRVTQTSKPAKRLLFMHRRSWPCRWPGGLLSLALLALILHVSLELSVVINQSLHSQASGPLTVAAFMQEVLTNPLSVS